MEARALTASEATAALVRYRAAFGARAFLVTIGWLGWIGLLGARESYTLATIVPVASDLAGAIAVSFTLRRLEARPLGFAQLRRARIAAGLSAAIDAVTVGGMIASPSRADALLAVAGLLAALLSLGGTTTLTGGLATFIDSDRASRFARVGRVLGIATLGGLLLAVGLFFATPAPAVIALALVLLTASACAWLAIVVVHLLLVRGAASAVRARLAVVDDDMLAVLGLGGLGR